MLCHISVQTNYSGQMYQNNINHFKIKNLFEFAFKREGFTQQASYDSLIALGLAEMKTLYKNFFFPWGEIIYDIMWRH